MVSKIFSAVLQGLNPRIIEVEVAANRGLRAFNIVGLADIAIKEAKERVSSAIKSVGFSPPHHQTKRIIVNLAPADIKKEGTLYDLAIALSYLLASEQAKFSPENKLVFGELALDGRLKPINGALAFALTAKNHGFSEVILPEENAKEASLISLFYEQNQSPIKIIGVKTLKQALDYLEKRQDIAPFLFSKEQLPTLAEFEINFDWIKGQTHAKRGLEIAAAGGHNIFLNGPPGTGKTLLAKAIVSILPELNPSEILELTQIYSISSLLNPQNPVIYQRPFRSPHHTSSEAAIIGGSSPPKVGEITLAHRGILFLDEFPEFHRDVLESLRQPIEEGKITISRARHNLTFPAKFTLVGAANPCPCGYKASPEKECSCTNSQIASYKRKLSGPLMDRIDIFCWVPAVKYEDLISESLENKSDLTKDNVKKARDLQKERFKNENILTNSEMNLIQIKKYCQIDSSSQALLKSNVESGKLSARGFHRVLKTSRTIADLEQRGNIAFPDVHEALMYRLRENE